MMGSAQVLLKEVIKEKSNVSFIEETSTVAYAIQTMSELEKHYLPVLSTDKHRIECMLSLFDLINAVVMHPEPHAKETTLAYLSSSSISMTSEPLFCFRDTVLLSEFLKKGVIHEAIVVSEDYQDKIAESCELGNILMDPETFPVYTVSQMDVLKYLNKHPAMLGEKNVACEQLIQYAMKFRDVDDPNQPLPSKLGSKKFSLHYAQDVPAITCFKGMAMHRLSSVALTNEKQELVDCITISDFRYFISNPPGIFQPATDYLKNNRGILPLIAVHPGDDMETVIAKMVEKNVHHVWVLRENKPIGSIDASDIIAFVA